MDKFSIGEIAEARTNNGWTECEILTNEYYYYGDDGYDVAINGLSCTKKDSKAGEWHAKTELLRKKKPPATNQDVEETKEHGTGDWDLMPWRPEKEKVES